MRSSLSSGSSTVYTLHDTSEPTIMPNIIPSPIPTLTWSSDFRQWKSAMIRLLGRLGVIRNLHGTYVEPFRLPIDDCTEPEIRFLRPPGQVAGMEPPAGRQIEQNYGLFEYVTVTSTGRDGVRPTFRRRSKYEGAILSREEMREWQEWSDRENLARYTILEHVSEYFRQSVALEWSASDLMAALEQNFDMTSQQRLKCVQLDIKLQDMCVPDTATTDELLAHVDKFSMTLADARRAGINYADGDVVEIFLCSLPQSARELLQLKMDVTDGAYNFDTLAKYFVTYAVKRCGLDADDV